METSGPPLANSIFLLLSIKVSSSLMSVLNERVKKSSNFFSPGDAQVWLKKLNAKAERKPGIKYA